MNDLERLHLLEKLLNEAALSKFRDIGKLANDIESLCESISDKTQLFIERQHLLWDTLEIMGVNSLESNRKLNATDIQYLNETSSKFLEAVKNEANKRKN